MAFHPRGRHAPPFGTVPGETDSSTSFRNDKWLNYSIEYCLRPSKIALVMCSPSRPQMRVLFRLFLDYQYRLYSVIQTLAQPGLLSSSSGTHRPKHDTCLNCNSAIETTMHYSSKMTLHKLPLSSTIRLLQIPTMLDRNYSALRERLSIRSSTVICLK